MYKFKKGDIVGRISYNKDVLFEISNIIGTKNTQVAILKGITERIEADSPIKDLEIMNKRIVKDKIKQEEEKITNRINKYLVNSNIYVSKLSKILNFRQDNRSVNVSQSGRILHLDGDKRYSEKSFKYYKSLGLNAIVKNIPESRQPQFVRKLLDKYMPDILIVTGHDGMIKKGTGFNDIYNYRNSRHFINTVYEARRWDSKKKKIAIFAGACQSYYEALIEAGANFASSPRKNNDRFYRSFNCCRKNSNN